MSRDIETSQFYNPLTTITKQVYAFATSHLSDDKIQALDVVEFAVTLFENCETFNAGKYRYIIYTSGKCTRIA